MAKKLRQSNIKTSQAVSATCSAALSLPSVILILTRLTDGVTAGMLLFPFVFYLTFLLWFSLVCRRRISRFVRIYANNRFYINAKESARRAFWKTSFPALFIALTVVLSAPLLGRALFGSVKARLPLYAAAACILVQGLSASVSGFLDGMGQRGIVVLTDVLRGVLTLIGGIFAALLGYRYGALRDALFFTNDCAGTYAALFCMLAIFVTDALILVVLLLARGRTLRRLEALEEEGKPRYLGENPELWKAVWQILVTLLVPAVLLLVSLSLFTSFSRANAQAVSEADTGIWLLHAHVFSPVFLLAVALFLPQNGRCQALADKKKQESGEEEADAGMWFYLLIHRQYVWFFPAGLFLAALAKPFLTALFVTPPEAASLLLTAAGFLSALLALAMCRLLLLALTKRLMPLFLCAVLSLFAGVVCAALFVRAAQAGVYAVICGLLTASAVFDMAAFLMLRSYFQARSYLFLRPFLVILCAASFSALLVYLGSLVLVNLIGEIATILLSVLAGTVLYFVILALARGLEEDELEAIPGGKLLERISARRRR